METLTTLHKILKEDTIDVPGYQRTYYWESPCSREKYSQVAVFLEDILQQINSTTRRPYYLGHFIFEKDGDSHRVVDGQQRLTTASILLSAVFMKIQTLRPLTAREEMLYEDTLKRGNFVYRFSTADCDNKFFRDYVIDQTLGKGGDPPTPSASRIADCFDYYSTALKDYDDTLLQHLLSEISKATCTTHTIKDTTEAIRLFTFHNNRGQS